MELDKLTTLYQSIDKNAEKYDKEIVKVSQLEERIQSRLIELSPIFDDERHQVLEKLKNMRIYVCSTWERIKRLSKSAIISLDFDIFNESVITINRFDPLESIITLFNNFVKTVNDIKSAYDITSGFINSVNTLIFYLNKFINDFDYLNRIYWMSGKADEETVKLLNEISEIEASLSMLASDIFSQYEELRLELFNQNYENQKRVENTHKKVEEYPCPIFFKLGYKMKKAKEFKFSNHSPKLGLEDQYLYEYDEVNINLDEIKETNDAVLFAYERGINKYEIIDILKDNAFESYPKNEVLNMIIDSTEKAEELINIIKNTSVDNIPLYNTSHTHAPMKVPFAYITNPELVPFDSEYASDKAFLFFVVFDEDKEKYEKNATHIYYVKRDGEEIVAFDKKNNEYLKLRNFK